MGLLCTQGWIDPRRATGGHERREQVRDRARGDETRTAGTDPQ